MSENHHSVSPGSKHSPRGKFIRAAVPSFVGWATFPRAASNLLAFALTIFVSVWSVHQTEYLIEFGSRFGAVMAPGGEHGYMAPMGACIAAAFLGGVALLTGGLLTLQVARGRLASRLPGRLARRLQVSSAPISPGSLLRTAAALLFVQILVYALQENAESFLAFGSLPGLAVILAPEHLTVLPLHLVAAWCGAVLLWTVYFAFRRERYLLQLARVLARLAVRGHATPAHVSPGGLLPDRRPRAGSLGLRSPPLAA